MDLEKLKYPIGKFKPPASITPAERDKYIAELAALPAKVRSEVETLTEDQLDTPYRPGGWTIRQLVHHIPDSHLNSYIRFKWALTESTPLIKAYHENEWAQLKDSSQGPVEMSLDLLESVHARWVWMLRNLNDDDWEKCFVHPETKKTIPLDLNLSLYSWHGNHHLAHIISLKKQLGWT